MSIIIAPHVEPLVELLLAEAARDSVAIPIVGASIVRNGHLLLIQRAQEEDTFPNHFEIPGGRVEHGENLLEAVMREVKEETNLDTIGIHDHVSSFDFIARNGKLMRQWTFVVEPSHYEIRLDPREHQSFLWQSLHDITPLDALLMTTQMRTTVERIRETHIGKIVSEA